MYMTLYKSILSLNIHTTFDVSNVMSGLQSIRRPVQSQVVDTYVEDGPTHVENHGTFFDVIFVPAPAMKLEDVYTPIDGEDSLILDDVLVSKFSQISTYMPTLEFHHDQLGGDVGQNNVCRHVYSQQSFFECFSCERTIATRNFTLASSAMKVVLL